MTLFGTTLDSTQIFALVSLLSVAILWTFTLRGENNYAKWFKRWEAERKTRRDAEIARETGGSDATKKNEAPKGPWG